MQKNRKWRGVFWGSMVAIFSIIASGETMADTHVDVYDMPACYQEAEGLELSVNGENVPIIEYTDLYNHANFSFDGEVEVKITIPAEEEIKDFTISPLAHGLEGTVNGNELTFSLEESKYLLIKINDYKVLALAADEREMDVPAPEGSGIYNIAKAPYNGTGSTPENPNSALQKAIDDANKAGGGTVYVPNGVYYTKNIILKSNVSLYLEPSAVIRATGNWEDYQRHYRKNGLKMDGTWFITNEPGAENIRIYGRGFLDGNGHLMRQKGHLNHLLLTMQLSGLNIDGITIKDAGFWMVVISRSDDINIQNVKLYNENLKDYENDAIDICESQDVLVQHAIAISEDDTYSTKTWNKDTDIAEKWVGEPEELNRVTFDDCLGWSRCCSFKVGAGCSQPMRNITFQNSYSYNSMVAMKVTPAYADAGEYSYVENTVFENIDVEGSYPHNGEWFNCMWLQLEAQNDNIPIYDTLLKNINVRELHPQTSKSRLNGRSNAKFEGVVMDHITLPDQKEPAKTLEEIGINTNGYYEGLIILPGEIHMDEKNIVLHDDFNDGLNKTEASEGVKHDLFSGYNSGGVIRTSKQGDAYVIYDAQNAGGIELRVNSYQDNRFPVNVFASNDEYGDTMEWQAVTLGDPVHGDYSDTEMIKFWKWDTYEGSLPEGVKYVKIELPVPTGTEKMWWLLLDDVLLYSDEEIQPSIEMRPSQEEVRIKTRDKKTLYPIIKNMKDPVITYASSDETVAVVDENGVVTALEQGETVVTAALKGTGKTASARIYAYKEAEDVALFETAIVLDKGEVYQLEALVTPEDSQEKVRWTSTNSQIVAVDEDGQVTALKYGKAVIWCETENHKKASCSVEVARKDVKLLLHDPLDNPEFPEGMLAYEATENLNYDVFNKVTDGGVKRLNNEKDAYLIYEVHGAEYVQYKLDYNTETQQVQDEIDVFVSKDGEEWVSAEMEDVDLFSGIRSGWNQVTRINTEAFEKEIRYIKLAIPQIKDLGGKGTRFWALIIDDVEIYGKRDEVEKITVEGPAKVKEGEEASYTAAVVPDSAEEQSVVWSVTDPSGQETQLAEIDSATGILKALKTGKIRVTAKAVDESGISGSLDVEIVKDAILVDTIVIQGETVLGFHETAEYTALIFPENADDQRVEWLLEDMGHEDIAVISEDGVVETGEIEGTFVIKASASDASRAVGTLKVRVQEEVEEKIPVEEIEIEGPDQVKQGEKVRYKAIATPANATKKDVVWTVENLDGRASISENGTLTAKTPGEVRIIAAATDGSGVTEERVVEIMKRKSGSSGSGGSSEGGGSSSRSVKRYYAASAGSASGWRKDDRGWWLAVGTDGYAKDEWKLVDGKWYFFDRDGYMVTGWKRLNQNQWYYMMEDGAMAAGWLFIDGEWYYFYPSGEMAADVTTPDGYFVDGSGRWNKR